MAILNCTLLNFSGKDLFLLIFEDCPDEFEYTANGVFRRTTPSLCPKCGSQMNYNGYNTYRKASLGNVKIGQYICPCCRKSCEEERSFWEKFFDALNFIYQRLRVQHVSYQGIASVMDLIFPRGKDTILNAFNGSVEKTEIPPRKTFIFDEQYYRMGRTHKYCLILPDCVTGRPVLMSFLIKMVLKPSKFSLPGI